jgi:hypothetical protein
MTGTPPNYTKNVEISLANSGAWIGASDVGAVTLLLRLAILIDTMLDLGETKDLAPLVMRAQSLMVELKLTPASRDTMATSTIKEEVKDGDYFAQTYLRIVETPRGNDTAKGKKPGTSSSRTNGKPGGTPTRVAKTSTRSGTTDKRSRAVSAKD